MLEFGANQNSSNLVYRGGNFNNSGSDYPAAYRNNNSDNTNNNIRFQSWALVLFEIIFFKENIQ